MLETLQLNPEQLKAAKALKGYNLVIASAGTGKTSTIVGRILYLLDNGIKPEEILLLTFTNKASNEMIARVAKYSKSSSKIEAGTFHAVAYRYLKEHYPNLSLKQPKELKKLLESIVDTKNALTDDDKKPYTSQHLYALYSLYTNALKQEDFSAWLSHKNPEHTPYAAFYENILDEFENTKKKHNYIDYNDLLLLFKQAMLERPSPYKEVLCDEFQDTNPLQESILDAINPPSLFCVGDYDQSIYAFNGADISIISNFTQKYKNAQVFTLTKNYRSSKEILDLANQVIQRNERIYPKNLEVVKSGHFNKPVLLNYNDNIAQCQDIAKRIVMRKNFKEVAVIFRNNASADQLEAALRSHNVPSKRKGSASFFESKEVALALDICALIFNPKDIMAAIHVLSHISDIGSNTAKDIHEALMLLGDGDLKLALTHPSKEAKIYTKKKEITSMGLFEEIFALENSSRFNSVIDKAFHSHPVLMHPKISLNGAKMLSDFFILYTKAPTHSPSALIKHILESAFFQTFKTRLLKERSKNKDGSYNEFKKLQAQKRFNEKMDLLSSLAKNYQNLGRFLNGTLIGSSEATQGEGVNLLSVHASKGLEFKDVYIIDLMEGRFPNHKLMNTGGGIEEERRLFYVAITRAKENLWLSYAKNELRENAKPKEHKPSVFLYEAGLLKPDLK
ncbi:ATP-dependent helicase [Helicobacter pylori]|uniref:ATP-dependent helicase n=1 Tax=Helicobacter pylori TaxID=210 RepID=UPI0001F46CFE|nr:ATP-dependent helicase [Helicobacter pylori]WRC20220.1 ATP-dependent helicase [Helicobacter pylori]BAJ59995.1 rep helicase, single-stranded DNA-dependent ATPase [Helicobacter pylori F57]GHR47208.1 DNA helicase [Helicobacter pylori]